MEQLWLPTREEVQQRLEKLYAFVEEYRSVCEAHSVDYYLHDNWVKCLPPRFREEILAIADQSWFIDPPLTPNDDPSSFLSFLHKAKELRLSLTSNTAPTQDVTVQKVASFAMTAKKSHEVDKFSHFVKECMLNKSGRISQIVDVGSGKGYLSECLARTCGVSVVGLDSQMSNTEGALKRKKKVTKEWKSIHKVEKNTSSQVFSDLSSNDITFSDENLSLPNLFSDSGDDNGVSLDVVAHTCTVESTDNTPHEEFVSEETAISSRTLNNDAGIEPYINEPLEIAPSSADGSRAVLKTPSINSDESSFYPLTMRVTHNNCDTLLSEAERLSDGKFDSQRPFCIVGLHACGDLTSTALRMYTAIPKATALCVVGCCYHHITEEGDASGFPLSKYLMSIGAHLGRTMRMLACQTLARLIDTTSGEALRRVQWRSMLQVLLSRSYPELFNSHSGGPVSELVVGRIKKPVHDFKQYCILALTRLRLDPAKVDEKEMKEIDEELSARILQLQKFLRVRAVLAACIESVIILDRFLFLIEQDCTSTAGLVQLFDPVTSPRCYAIVAV